MSTDALVPERERDLDAALIADELLISSAPPG